MRLLILLLSLAVSPVSAALDEEDAGIALIVLAAVLLLVVLIALLILICICARCCGACMYDPCKAFNYIAPKSGWSEYTPRSRSGERRDHGRGGYYSEERSGSPHRQWEGRNEEIQYAAEYKHRVDKRERQHPRSDRVAEKPYVVVKDLGYAPKQCVGPAPVHHPQMLHQDLVPGQMIMGAPVGMQGRSQHQYQSQAPPPQLDANELRRQPWFSEVQRIIHQ